MTTGWTLDGVNLRTLAYEIRTVDGWDAWPGLRGNNPIIPYLHGAQSEPRKWFSPRTLSLLLLFFDTNASGAVTYAGGTAAHRRENIDNFWALCRPGTALHDLRQTHVLPAGTTQTRQAWVEAIAAAEVEEAIRGATVRQALVTFDMPHPFWRVLPQKTQAINAITTATHAFNMVTGGNAPIDTLVATFTANAAILNPRLEVDATGEFVQYSGSLATNDVLVLDIRRRLATINGVRATAGVTWGHAWWMQLSPAATVAMTASVSSGSNYDLDLAWYDAYLTS